MANDGKTPPPPKEPPKRPEVEVVGKTLIASGGFKKEHAVNNDKDSNGKR